MRSYLTLIIASFSFINATYNLIHAQEVYENKIFDSHIKTVQLYPNHNDILDQLLYPTVNISKQNLILEFDELAEDAMNYRAKIVSCTADWEPSELSSLEYLFEYNEFNITNYAYSIDTDHEYVHYKFNIPPVKVSGNYVVVVYNEYDEEEILLMRRFMVFENKVQISSKQSFNNIVNLSRKNQQLEFLVNYNDYNIDRPRQNVKVQIRQNNRWDNVITNIQPAFVRDDIKQMEFRFMNDNQLFTGGNEFRWFDFRSIRSPGFRVHKLIREGEYYHLEVEPDKTRANLAYAQYQDKNGGYYIYNYDFDSPGTSSNYVLAQFTLDKSKVPSNSQIYLFGAMTDYELKEEYQLKYDNQLDKYSVELLLKQGHYDYQYLCIGDNIPRNCIEGDYFETENSYEILIYHRPFGARADRLVGYLQL